MNKLRATGWAAPLCWRSTHCRPSSPRAGQYDSLLGLGKDQMRQHDASSKKARGSEKTTMRQPKRNAHRNLLAMWLCGRTRTKRATASGGTFPAVSSHHRQGTDDERNNQLAPQAITLAIAPVTVLRNARGGFSPLVSPRSHRVRANSLFANAPPRKIPCASTPCLIALLERKID